MCSHSKSVWFKFQSTLDRLQTLRSQPPWHIYVVDAPQVLGSPAFSVCWGCPVGRQVHWLLGLQLVHSQDLPMPNHVRWQRAGQSCRGFHRRQLDSLDSPWLSGGTFWNLDFNLILTWLPLAQAEEAWKQRQGGRMDGVELTLTDDCLLHEDRQAAKILTASLSSLFNPRFACGGLKPHSRDSPSL